VPVARNGARLYCCSGSAALNKKLCCSGEKSLSLCGREGWERVSWCQPCELFGTTRKEFHWQQLSQEFKYLPRLGVATLNEDSVIREL
jgi:hypothetical protein